jgi:hypothetical protein
MQVKELLNKTEFTAVITNPVLKAGTGKESWEAWRDHTFAKEIYILRLVKYYDSVYQIQYHDPKLKAIASVNIPSSFDIVPTELLGVKKLYTDFVIKNINSNLNHNFTMGTDPEIFVTDKKKLINAFDFLGSKAEPTRHACNTIYWDGFQAEFTTVASQCLEIQTNYIQQGLQGIYREAKKFYAHASLSMKSTFDIPSEILVGAKKEHVAFGCMPSLNAYKLESELVMDGRECPFRMAGGHIHFGFNSSKKEPDTVINMVKALDAILGVACVSLFAKYDDPKRRLLYGLPGEYRLPAHGMEYRTLSNAWLCHPMIMNIVFDISRRVAVFGEKKLMDYWDATEKETIETILRCDVKNAKKILKRNNEIFKKIITSAYGNGKDPEVLYNVFLDGLDSVVVDPNDVVGNWNLEKDWVNGGYGLGKNWYTGYNIIKSGKKVS